MPRSFQGKQMEGREHAKKEEMENENDIVMKIKLQNIIWVNSSCVLKSAPAGSAHMALVLFFLVQMSQRISAKGKTPAWGLFSYRLINHFPSFPFQSLPKLNLMKRLSFKYVIYCTLNGKLFRKGSDRI